MARFMEPKPEAIAAWSEWVAERPIAVQAVAKRFDPWTLYKLKSSNHRVTIYSIEENIDKTITLKVNVSARFNFLAFERQVFGISPDDLEECELPGENEILGSMDLDIETAKELLKISKQY